MQKENVEKCLQTLIRATETGENYCFTRDVNINEIES